MVEINEGIAGPEAFAQFLSRDNFAGILKKDNQNLEGLFCELESETVLAELAGLQIHLENAKMQYSRNRRRATHESGCEYSAVRAQGSKLERESSIRFVFNDKLRDAEMFLIGRIEHCTRPPARCKLSRDNKILFVDLRVLDQKRGFGQLLRGWPKSIRNAS